jgi:two-component system sensor histidine kinase GlrK
MMIVIFLGVYITLTLNRLNHLTRTVSSIDGATIRLVEQLLDTIFSQVGFEKKYMISKDQDFLQQFWEIEKYFREDLKKLVQLVDTAEKKKYFSEVRLSYGRYLSLFKEEAGLVEKGQDYSPGTYQKEKEKIIDSINKELTRLIRLVRSDRDKKIKASSQISSRVLKVSTITAVIAMIAGLLISFFNTKSINRSILLLQKKTKEIAKGKFEEIPNIKSPPEIKELADDFNVMCDRLKELDDMKVDLISHISHELRTPLTAMKEATSMLLEGTFANVPEKRQELLNITREECERLINAVNRILDLSRMEAKMMDYQFRECSLVRVIQKTVLKLAPIAQRKKIELELKPPPELPSVNVDEERIGQVVADLLGNALKFTPEKGAVIIDVSLPSDDNGYIEVKVSDTGCGILKENLERIFDKFKRIDVGQKTVRGTGLGLPIAKYIIAAHGGKIWAESMPGKGSTFFFTLPV